MNNSKKKEPFKVNLCKGVKKMTGSRLKAYYDSDEFKTNQSKIDRSDLASKRKKAIDLEWNAIKNDYENGAKNRSLLDAKEHLLCRSMFRILLVDDNPDILDIMTEYIKSHCGFLNIDTATNGKRALELVSHYRYDLVLSDFDMPEMHGYDLFEELNNIEFKGKFVIVSGYNDLQLEHLKSAGILCLPKGSGKLADKVKKIVLGYYARKLNRMLAAVGNE